MSERSHERPAGDETDRRRAAAAIPTGLADASPTWELPRGRNVLTVRQVPRVARGSRSTPPLRPHVIPFWL